MSSAGTGPDARKPTAIPTEQECEDARDTIQDIIDDKPDAKGLAIVIGSSNALGASDDAKNIKSAFETLGFAVYAKRNGASLNAISKIVQAVAKYCKYKECYKCFVFYYAGHGGSDDGHGYIEPKAGERLYITEGIVDLFTPEAKCTNKYRLFFFDCCLSDGSRDNESKKRPLGNLPAGANMLVAYATSMKYKSKGYEGLGGTWTSVLHKNLLQDLSITTILDKTCDEVINKCIIDENNQAPHYISSVGILCLKSWIFTWEQMIDGKGGQLLVPGAGHGHDDRDEGENCSLEDPSNSKLTKNRKRKQQSEGDSHLIPKTRKQEQQRKTKQSGPKQRRPTQNTASIINKVPPLNEAYDILRKRSTDWDDIGTALDGVSGNNTSNLRKGLIRNMALTDSSRLECILDAWLQRGADSSTWDQLMKALNKLDYNEIVKEIKEFLELADE